MLYFEHPLTERIRSLIRIEHLYNRFNHTAASEDKWLHHTALVTLFEMMDCSSRAELKLDILQELERQRQSDKNKDNPEIWNALQQASQNLQEIQQRFGQHIRENEWLMALKQRISIAGGTTPLEFPGYYFWQKQPAEQRQQDLQKWSSGMMPTCRAVKLLLEILRSNGTELDCCAQKGSYQHQSLDKNTHLLIVKVAAGEKVLPEMSANKYFTHIRFLHADQENVHGKAAEKDVAFKMTVCSLDAKNNR